MIGILRPVRFLAALLSFLLLHGLAQAEPRIALVIGNSSYGGEIGNLANPVNDAKLMAKTLRGIGFEVIEVEEADQNAMKRAIVDFGNKLGDAGSDATGLFYYAGHGLQVQGENFLIPVNAHIERESDVDVEAVSADLVLKQMDFAGGAVNIVILDACRNNPMSRGFRSQVRGLAEFTRKPHGSFIAYSTAPGEVAADGKGTNSPYAKALAESITEPGLGIEEIFRDVRAKVLAATDNKQTPWDASSLTAPFFFKAPVQAAAPEPAAPAAAVDSMDPKRIELAFWDSIKDSKDPDDFQAYLAKYPNGDFAALAANRLKTYGATQTAAAAPQSDAAIRNIPPAKDDATAALYESTFWDSVKDSGRSEDIQAYLNKYPHGQFAGAAQQKLGALGAPPPAPQVAAVVPPPLPPFDAVNQKVYARDRARLRATPFKDGEVVGRVAAGAALNATGRTSDGAWWRIATDDGKTGYIAGSVVSDQPPASSPGAVASTTPAPASTPPGSTPPGSASPAGSPPGPDADTCKTGSGAAPADRVAACRRVLDGNALDKDARVTALIDYGNAYFDGGQYDQAMPVYRQALELDPNSAAAYYDIGTIHSSKGRYSEARAAFDKAAALDPSDPDAVYRRGQATASLGDFDSGLRDVQRALAMKGKDDVYYLEELGVIHMANGDAAAATADIDRALAADSEYWGGSGVLITYLNGAYDKSEAMAARAMKSDTSYAYWWLWKALAQKASGDESGAAATLGEARAVAGKDWPAALIDFVAGKIDENKLRSLAKSADNKTQSERLCEINFYRGELAYRAGDKATARAAWRQAVEGRIYYYLEYAAAVMRLNQLND